MYRERGGETEREGELERDEMWGEERDPQIRALKVILRLI